MPRARTPALLAAGALVLSAGLAAAGALPASSAASARARPASAGATSVVYSFGVVGTGFGPKITSLEHRVPSQVRGIPGTVVEVATSNSDTYALTAAGTVWAWGAGANGELGNGTTTPFAGTPVEVHLPAGVRVTALANPMPYDSALVVDSTGRVYGWGYNWRHSICLARTDVLTPRPLPLSGVTLAVGAGGHSLFDAGGRVYACGRNSAGELGDGTTADAATPTPVHLPEAPVRALVASWQDSGALLANGSYYDWGFNRGGQLGDGTTVPSSLPVRVHLPGPVRTVSQGGSRATNGQTLAVLADGSVWAWGDGSYGQLGDGTTAPSRRPVRVAFPPGVRIRQVFSGGDSSYALSATGTLWSWGGNRYGQLGDGTTTPRARPAPVGLRLSEISATATNAAGLVSTGSADARRPGA
ncbi:MAG TPA: hypothetical protein VKV23_07240 [Acidimicrobiales bacterium]|nr:hypothetical protein [Acidimicrobiales bacterium]